VDHVLNETSPVDAGRGFFVPNSLTKSTSHFLRNRHRLERARVAFLAGPTIAVREWLVLDVGGIVAIAGPQPRALYGGLTYNVGRLWK